MKRLLTVVFVMGALFCCLPSQATTNEYYIDDQSVESALNAGVSVQNVIADAASETLAANVSFAPFTDEAIKGNDNEAIAFVLAFVIGYLGIHRIYMGTSTGVVIGYILTCGGLGIVATIDWIVLLIALVKDDKDISEYVDSKRFFMWAGK